MQNKILGEEQRGAVTVMTSPPALRVENKYHMHRGMSRLGNARTRAVAAAPVAGGVAAPAAAPRRQDWHGHGHKDGLPQ